MTFDQWIDIVNAQVRGQGGSAVRTEELSWDGAVWKSAGNTAVAALDDDGVTAKVFFDGGEKFSLAFDRPEGEPLALATAILERLTV
jgi:hypothetical protein